MAAAMKSSSSSLPNIYMDLHRFPSAVARAAVVSEQSNYHSQAHHITCVCDHQN